MIQIELSQALLMYSVIIGVLAVAIWAYTSLAVYRPQRYLGRQYLWRCLFCRYTYLDEEAVKVSECPRCGSFNSLDDEATKRERPAPAEAMAAEAVEQDGDKQRNTSKRKRGHQRKRGPRRRR